MDHHKHNFSKDFECIYFPARIVNIDRAVQTLGGTNKITEICNGINTRLELKFRPEDPYCKPTLADRVNCTGLLLNVKIVKKKRKSGQQSMEIIPQVVGKVSSMFQFKSMCDYQFLPVKSHSDDHVVDILPDLLFSNVPSVEDLNKDIELFMPPVYFSKMDTPQMQLKLFHNPKSEENQSDSRIGSNRKSREAFTDLVSFEREGVPQAYNNDAARTRLIKSNLITQEDFDAVCKVFESRPVVSKTVLRASCSVYHKRVRLILPLIAYYFYSGPFRSMWVKLGYDPRIDQKAAVYQVLDFRWRTAVGSYSKDSSLSQRSLMHRLAQLMNQASYSDPEGQLPHNYSNYRPGYVPPFKQMLYQSLYEMAISASKSHHQSYDTLRPKYIIHSEAGSHKHSKHDQEHTFCDIEIPEVQGLLANSPLRDLCHEKFGFYPEGIHERVRVILSETIVNTLCSQIEMVPEDETLDDSSITLDDVEDEEELLRNYD